MHRILYLALGWTLGVGSTIGYVLWAGQRYRAKGLHG